MFDEKNTKAEIFSAYQKLLKEAKGKKISIPSKAAALNARNTKGDLLDAFYVMEKLLHSAKEELPESVPEQMALSSIADIDEESEIPAPKIIEPKPPLNPDTKTIPKPIVPEKQTSAAKPQEDDKLSLLSQDILDKLASLEKAKLLRLKQKGDLDSIELELKQFIGFLNQAKEDLLTHEKSYQNTLTSEEEKYAAQLDSLTQELQEKTEGVNLQLEQTTADAQEKVKQRDETRAIAQEQYIYEFSMRQKQEDDLWADELAKREAALKELSTEIRLLQDSLAEREKLIPEFQKKLDELPSLLDTARTEGAEEREKEMMEEFAHQEEMAKKDAESAIQNLERQIQNLNEDYNALLTEKNSVQDKLDKAYDESNKLYLQTIQSTGGIKILNAPEQP
ncbi:MAG: hypothetical protein IJU50_10620 [Lachnospiraceae bacterium]|nr:hypothetical protein [Lachnospiraceae bacterium]